MQSSSRLAFCAAFALLPTGSLVAGESVDRLGRLFGYSWSDGYHACAEDCFQMGENLPPRSYAADHSRHTGSPATPHHHAAGCDRPCSSTTELHDAPTDVYIAPIPTGPVMVDDFHILEQSSPSPPALPYQPTDPSQSRPFDAPKPPATMERIPSPAADPLLPGDARTRTRQTPAAKVSLPRPGPLRISVPAPHRLPMTR